MRGLKQLALLLLMISAEAAAVPSRPEIAAYYFPNWSVGDQGDWQNLVNAKPRFPGHQQPKSPVWGVEDERNPAVMAKKIDTAADHGVNAFIFCWYAFDGGKRYLDAALRKGLLQAPNRGRIKFALMWANHDVGGLGTGKVTPETWDAICEEVIRDFMSQPDYWRVAGRPYFSIYQLGDFIASFGSTDKAADAVRRFREKAATAGLPGLHLNGVLHQVSSGQTLRALGLDSLTSYVWVHHQVMPDFPATDYADFRDGYFAALDKGGWTNGLKEPAVELGLPYFPNVTVGWDPSPRCAPGIPWENKGGYPHGPVLIDNAPAEFEEGLKMASRYLNHSNTEPRVITLYAWNEWTEGGFLEPEARTGTKYLEAIRSVFPTQ